MTSEISYRHNHPIGRLPILNVEPTVDAGRWAAKAFVGEVIPFSAVSFREGHDALGVELLLTNPKGDLTITRMHAGAAGTDSWHTAVQLEEQGVWTFQIRAFSDEYETWHHNTEVKLAAGVDEELMMLEGVALFTRAAAEKDRKKTNAKELVLAAEVLADQSHSPSARFAAALNVKLLKAIAERNHLDTATVGDVVWSTSSQEGAQGGDLGRMAALDAGADDVESDEEGHWIYCQVESLSEVSDALEKALGESEESKIIFKPQTRTEVDLDTAQKLMRLIDMLEEDDDVQSVTHNFDMSDEVAAQLG